MKTVLGACTGRERPARGHFSAPHRRPSGRAGGGLPGRGRVRALQRRRAKRCPGGGAASLSLRVWPLLLLRYPRAARLRVSRLRSEDASPSPTPLRRRAMLSQQGQWEAGVFPGQLLCVSDMAGVRGLVPQLTPKFKGRTCDRRLNSLGFCR